MAARPRPRSGSGRLSAEEPTLEVSTDPEAHAGDVARVMAGLRASNLERTGDDDFRSYRAFLRSEGELIAGLLGIAFWGWMEIGTIWVREDRRRRGHATRLIGDAERWGLERGCHHAILDTFSFQARPVYERLGYRVVATLPSYPAPHERYLMTKELAPR